MTTIVDKPESHDKIRKPKLRRKPGRPRKARIKASDEPGARKIKRCSECHELGHTTKKYQGGLTAKEKKMLAFQENASQENDPPTSSTRGRGTSSRSSTTGSSKYVIHLYLFSISCAHIPH